MCIRDRGTGLCLLGALLGSVTVFLFVKKFGMRFVALFVSEEKIRSLKFLQNEKRLNLIAYILFLIPGTPKDVMTYIVGLTPMKLSFWIFITLTAVSYTHLAKWLFCRIILIFTSL